MILTLAFAFIVFLALWPFFIMVGVMDFKRSPEALEKQIPGRPARRTVGRINRDMMNMISGSFVLCSTLFGIIYGVPMMQAYVGNTMLLVMAILGSSAVFYYMTAYNRAAHAYASIGKILVVHLCCALSSYTAISFFLYGNTLNMDTAGLLLLFVFGTMLVFSDNQYSGKEA